MEYRMNFARRTKHYKQTYAKNYNKHHGVRDSELLEPNQSVRIKIDGKMEWEPATVTQVHDKPRSYNVVTEDGTTLRRNSKHVMSSKSSGQSAGTKDKNDTQPAMATTVSPRSVVQPPRNDGQQTLMSRQSSPVKSRSGRIIKAPSRLDL